MIEELLEKATQLTNVNLFTIYVLLQILLRKYIAKVFKFSEKFPRLDSIQSTFMMYH